ncbi:MAG: BatA domain-containing protein, partial [Candidatus Binatia bacterium]
MEFLHPAALLGLLALPLLLLPYLIRRKPRRVIFSSLLLLVETGDQASSRPWGKIHLPWIFFLQLLLLTLLIIALSEPVFSVRPTKIAIVLDNSASMQTLENGRSRFALAQEKARSVIAELAVTGQIDLFLTTPRLEKLGAAPLSPADAAKAIAALEAYDLGEPPTDYDHALNQLAHTHEYERLYLLTDHPGRGQSAIVRVMTVGQPQTNLALTGFEVQRSSLMSTRLDATVEASNFSNKDEKIRIVIKSSGKQIIASRELSVAAGKTAAATLDGIADHPYYQAEIEASDVLALDNRRFAVAPVARSLRILGVSPRPQELASLKAIPGVQIDLIAPSEYDKAERSGYGLEIFHFATPAGLPRTPALFVLPPQSSSLVDLAAPESNVSVSNWREPHVLTRYVNFSLFRPTYARALKPQTAGEIIIDSSNGPLAFAVQRQGIRYLTLGFDPFPYLGRDNLPMSIFTLNFLDWFIASGVASHATGEPIALGVIQPGDLLITPNGEKLSLKAGYDYFSGAVYQGIYQRSRGSEREILARNLPASGESDLRASAPIELRGGTVGAAGTAV